MQTNLIYILIFIVLAGGFFWFFIRGDRFELPRGETNILEEDTDVLIEDAVIPTTQGEQVLGGVPAEDASVSLSVRSRVSQREVFVTDGTKHSIPLDEILSGGPPKDGIPSIDSPKFIGITEADDFLNEESVGLGLVFSGEARFYPYQILVWHEIVNDNIQGNPILVTYCPLCATGIVFDRRVNGVEQEFGVSGLLWQSNLLMYNRTGDPDTESLWSQVLGEAVLGPETGQKLTILRSDTVRFGEWKKAYPGTLILSKNTGALRSYGTDPYEGYYSDRSVSFGATFTDTRLHPKTFIIGIDINGFFKAYPKDDLIIGITKDTFAGEEITIEKKSSGEVDVFAGAEKQPIPSIDGFWFSWIAVHPNTELYEN